ncbi:unnamed protein product, partial [Ectocarpus sp. 8 AP-2014]
MASSPDEAATGYEWKKTCVSSWYLDRGKSMNNLGVLSAVQERQFKRQRRAGSDATRAQFATQQMATSREKRSI